MFTKQGYKRLLQKISIYNLLPFIQTINPYHIMFAWLIIFIVIGSLVGYFMKDGKSGAAEGAATGFAVFFGILVKIILPLAIIICLFKACFGS